MFAILTFNDRRYHKKMYNILQKCHGRYHKKMNSILQKCNGRVNSFDLYFYFYGDYCFS